MRKAHRFVAVFALIFALYMASTGLFMQALDLKVLLADTPASDPTIQAIRVGQNGPPNFQVIGDGDYAAPALPSGLDYRAALVGAARAVAGSRFVEVRMADGRPVSQAAADGKVHRFDAVSGVAI